MTILGGYSILQAMAFVGYELLLFAGAFFLIGAFDDMWFENGEDGEFEPDYEYHQKNFIQKLSTLKKTPTAQPENACSEKTRKQVKMFTQEWDVTAR